MKFLALTLLLLLLCLRLAAQSDRLRFGRSAAPDSLRLAPRTDSLRLDRSAALGQQPPPSGRFAQSMQRMAASRAYRMTYLAVPLIVGGTIIQGRDREFRSLRHGYAPSFRHHYDDYLQYAPAGAMLVMKACGVKSRSSWGRMLVSDAFSVGVMTIAVNSLKYSVRVPRPDGSSNNSFPSGHTATAFMTATMFHKEYGGRSPWYSIAGYSVATVTGVSRMLNNRHWLSDVMVGAGIGILATEVGYLLADLIFKERGITHFNNEEYFDRYRKPSFLGLAMAVDVIPGTYSLLPNTRAEFSAGVSTNVEGAWFFSTYAGIGAQLGAGCFPLTLNGVAQDDRLRSASAYANAYGSYPITPRWLVGGKVSGGYQFFQQFASEEFTFGNRGGFSCGVGTSMTFRANESLDVRFCCDYRLLPPLTSTNAASLHLLSLSTSLNIAF